MRDPYTVLGVPRSVTEKVLKSAYRKLAKALRLKGKGLHGAGDLYATLRVVLPEQGDPDLESLMRFWRDQKPYKVRDN